MRLLGWNLAHASLFAQPRNSFWGLDFSRWPFDPRTGKQIRGGTWLKRPLHMLSGLDPDEVVAFP